MKTQLTNRYATKMNGVLSCCDRILMIGTLPGACYTPRGQVIGFCKSRGRVRRVLPMLRTRNDSPETEQRASGRTTQAGN